MAGHRARGFRAAAAIVGLVAALAVGCGRDTPQGPGQPSPVPPPAVGAPAIAAIESPASRFEVAQDLTLTAVVVPGEGGEIGRASGRERVEDTVDEVAKIVQGMISVG